jgi:hypothetical protein
VGGAAAGGLLPLAQDEPARAAEDGAPGAPPGGRWARPLGELAGTILLLAGALTIERLGRRGGGAPPSMPFVLIVGAPAREPDREQPLPQAIAIPRLAELAVLRPQLALAEVSR